MLEPEPLNADNTPQAPLPMRFENPKNRRYYEARILCNLFGEWEVFCLWGGIGSALGNSKAWPAADLNAAVKHLSAVTKRRNARGYQAVPR